MARKPAKKAKPKPRDQRARRHYTDEEREAALLAVKMNDGNVAYTAVQLKIPAPTLRCWANGWRHPDAMLLHQDKAGNLANAFEEVAWRCVMHAGEKIPDAPFNHLMTGAGIAVDKMRLLRGEPTTIGQNDNRNVNVNLTALLSKMSADERAQLAGLLETCARREHNGDSSGTVTVDGTRHEGELLPLPQAGVQGERPLSDIQG